jgi:Protein of unknown function (DUF2950)
MFRNRIEKRWHMNSPSTRAFESLGRLAIAFVVILAAALLPIDDAGAASNAQTNFASADEAVKALVEAAKAEDIEAIVRMFGPASRGWLLSGDDVQDTQTRKRFVAAYAEKSAIEMQGNGTAILSVGNDDFPFPFPLVQKHGRWSFDVEAGREELLNRWVGRDELNTIQALHAIVDAQREYAAMDRGAGHVSEYAGKFRSSPGKKDGLYWSVAAGEKESPLGPLVADAVRAGYRVPSGNTGPVPYQGYYFRILTGQGEHAQGGAYDYVVKGKMIGGFAVIAYPAKYGVSGVKAFMVNHDDVVFETDLGPHTQQLAEKIQKFDPGDHWTPER